MSVAFARRMAVAWAVLVAVAMVARGQEVSDRETLIIAIGASGAEEFEGEFDAWSQPWRKLAEGNGWELKVVDGSDTSIAAREQFQQAIEGHRDQNARLWIVMLGHGTYSKGVAKFNLSGPDVSSGEMKDWLKAMRCEVVVVNCSSASAPFMSDLSGAKRVIVSATRSGTEINYARFGKYMAESIGNLSSDIDHDESVSLLEAFLASTSRTERFYADEARLATEHALIEDNGDRTGTPGDFYVGIQASKVSKDGKPADGIRAARLILFSASNALKFSDQQSEQRDKIEAALDLLRSQKASLETAVYYAQLEPIMLELSQLYEAVEREQRSLKQIQPVAQ